MHILFLNGSEFRGTWHEFKRALWHPLFIALVLSMTAILLVVQPYNHFLPAGVISHTLIIASSIAAFFCAVLFGFSRFARAKRRARSLVVILPAIAIATVWAVALSMATRGSGLSPLGWAQLIAFNFAFAIFAEVFLASFLLRRIMLETGLGTHPIVGISPSILHSELEGGVVPPKVSGPTQTYDTAPAQPTDSARKTMQIVEILGKYVVLDTVRHLKAEEHYVSLTLRGGTSFLLRGRLADAIEQVPPEAGLQVHRSYWVARSALAALNRKRDGWRLRLRDGTEIPVARNRQAKVRDWVEAALQAA